MTKPPGRRCSSSIRAARLLPGLAWLPAVACLGWPCRAAAAEALEPGFVVSTFAEGLGNPVALEFAPDGRLFVADVSGVIRVVSAEGVVSPREFATIEVFREGESGLLGLALDPDFAGNGYVYLFATVSSTEQRILRLRDDVGVGVEETVIRGNLPTRGRNHSGGGLRAGPDGTLYFSIGDAQDPESAQDLNSLSGKIARINLDGSTPDDNPFTTPTGSPRAVYALGFRNPFRFCMAPDGRLFVLDVGSDDAKRREEINLVRRGDNCGWPLFEGSGGAALGFVDPIHEYHEEGAAPVGIVYYTGSRFPESHRGNLFHVEFVLNRIYRVVLDGDRVAAHTPFVQAEGGALDLTQGPDGALYYSELYTGRIMRVAPAGPSDGGDGEKDVSAGDAGESDIEADTFTDALDASPHATLCGFGALPASLLSLSGLYAANPRRLRRARTLAAGAP